MACAQTGVENAEGYIAVRGRLGRADGTAPAVLCAHGAGDLSIGVRTRPYCGAGDGRGIMHHLAEAGYLAVACDFAGLAYGNDASIVAVANAVAFAQGVLGAKAGKVGFYAASMGALAALNWTAAHLGSVGVLALHVPVVDLAEFHDDNQGGVGTANINNAYGGSAGYTAAEPTHNPARVAASFAGIPSQIWYATDETIPFSTRQSFAAAAGSTLTSLGAVGHQVATLDPAVVTSFILQHL